MSDVVGCLLAGLAPIDIACGAAWRVAIRRRCPRHNSVSRFDRATARSSTRGGIPAVFIAAGDVRWLRLEAIRRLVAVVVLGVAVLMRRGPAGTSLATGEAA